MSAKKALLGFSSESRLILNRIFGFELVINRAGLYFNSAFLTPIAFQDAISRLLLRYSEYGFVDQLSKKWYGRVPCFDDRLHRFNQPEPLSVGAVAGPFIMLLAGLGLGLAILVFEHVIFRYALPVLRKKPKECFWRSPNLMFFSQV